MSKAESPLRQVIVDITIAAPVDAVWTALRDPAQIRTWFGWDAPGLEEEIKFIFLDHASADAKRRVVQFGEWEGTADAVELTEVAGGTRLRVVRSGGDVIDWTGVYEDIVQGWINFFEQLRFMLEIHRGEPRRTIYLSGAARPGIGEPTAALGLTPIAAYRGAGKGWATVLATADQMSGRVWYDTHFQTALVVDQWGPGLLVVTDMGVSPRRPHGGGSVLLTTYGLADAAFAELERRWTSWWAERYEKPAG